MKDLLIPYKVPHYTKRRVGRIGDGGYIFYKEILYQSKYVYSYGISDKLSFDEAMAYEGKIVLMYDHTIDPPLKRADKSIVEHENLVFYKEPLSRDFYNHLKPEHLESTNMCLKIDAEGAEWDTFANCDERVFKHFSQIGCEFHYLDNNNSTQKEAFRRLLEHYTIFHIHGNNCASVRDGVPDVLEISLVHKNWTRGLEVIKEDVAYPVVGIDSPNDYTRPDIVINWWLE